MIPVYKIDQPEKRFRDTDILKYQYFLPHLLQWGH